MTGYKDASCPSVVGCPCPKTLNFISYSHFAENEMYPKTSLVALNRGYGLFVHQQLSHGADINDYINVDQWRMLSTRIYVSHQTLCNDKEYVAYNKLRDEWKIYC